MLCSDKGAYLEGGRTDALPPNAVNISRPPPNGDRNTHAWHRYATALTTTAQNIFIVYHFNFGIVLTGAQCSSIACSLRSKNSAVLPRRCCAPLLSHRSPSWRWCFTVGPTALSIKGRSDLNHKPCISTAANLLLLRLNNYCCFHTCSASNKMNSGWGFARTPLGELSALPQTPSWWEGLATYSQEPHPASVLGVSLRRCSSSTDRRLCGQVR